MPFLNWLYFLYQYTGQLIFFQMMPPLRSFDDVDGRERDQKKTDDLRAMTTLGPHTLQRNRAMYIAAFVFGHYVDSYFLRTLENAA